MPARRVTVAALIIALTSVTVTGCVADEPEVSASPSPSSTPVFASEEEALAAINSMYSAYVSVSNQILTAGGTAPERLVDLVTSSYYQEELSIYETFRGSGNHTSGEAAYDSLALQSASQNLRDGGLLAAYVCYDVTGVRLVNSQGVDVTPPDRPERIPLEIELTVDDESSFSLRLNGSETWTGDNFC